MEQEKSTPIDLTQLTDQIRVVSKARVFKASIDTKVKDSRAAWEAENQILLDNQKYQATTLEGCEGLLRELTVKAYFKTGNKAPAPGVGIRVTQALDYDTKEAMEWALIHRLALKLDVSGFEKIVKANPESVEFVSITEKTTATIATELAVPEE